MDEFENILSPTNAQTESMLSRSNRLTTKLLPRSDPVHNLACARPYLLLPT